VQLRVFLIKILISLALEKTLLYHKPRVKQAPEGRITVSVTGGGGNGSARVVAIDKGGDGNGG